jgi:hypothetical protein
MNDMQGRAEGASPMIVEERHFEAFSSAPRRRVTPVEEGSTQIDVD